MTTTTRRRTSDTDATTANDVKEMQQPSPDRRMLVNNTTDRYITLNFLDPTIPGNEPNRDEPQRTVTKTLNFPPGISDVCSELDHATVMKFPTHAAQFITGDLDVVVDRVSHKAIASLTDIQDENQALSLVSNTNAETVLKAWHLEESRGTVLKAIAERIDTLKTKNQNKEG